MWIERKFFEVSVFFERNFFVIPFFFLEGGFLYIFIYTAINIYKKGLWFIFKKNHKKKRRLKYYLFMYIFIR